MRRLAFLALAGLSACGGSSSTITVGFAQPSAVVVFRGVAPDPRKPGLRPYFAVANAARADLTLIDAVDDTPVLAPVIVRSLAVPVPDARPTLLAASSLFDGAGAEAKADLLVVASSGAPLLQLVETWVATSRVVDEADLGALAPGAAILALAAVPVPDAATPPASTAGRVRVVAALSGARLAVVEYVRAADGGIARGAVSVVPLAGADGAPFDAVSLAVNPHDPLHLYAASPDPIGGVEGVAELTMAGEPAAWTIRGISARAPTRFVAAARLRERLADWPPQPPGPYDDRYELGNQPVDRVYAVLDPARCGPNERIGCGIAVLDPATGIVPDYAGLMPYLAPISLPQLALGLAVAEPPAARAGDDATKYAPEANDPPGDPGYMKIAPATGPRATTAVAAIPSGDGRVYFADLSRYAVPNDQSILRTSTRTRVTDGLALGVAVPGEDLPRILGIWEASSGVQYELAFDATGIANGVRVTPGFTPTDAWRISFQGVLPGLDARFAQSGATADASTTWIAFQVPAGASGVPPTQVARVYDPALGVREGDLVEISAPEVSGCPSDGNVEATIAAILPPAEAYPGGALALAPLDDVRPKVNEDGSAGPWRDWPACIAALRGGQRGFHAAVRAAEMLVVGAATGYAGRPPIVPSAELATSSEFTLEYEDEDALEAQCPLLPWPADWRTAPPEFAACDAACRLTCERLVLARRSRRIYHVSDQCTIAEDDASCRETWAGLDFPRANGPVFALRLGYRGANADGGLFPADDRTLWSDLRLMQVSFATRNGLAPSYRIPTTSTSSTASVLPLGVSTFDRSTIEGRVAEGYRFLVPYANDFILDFSASEPVNVSKVIR